MKKVAPEITRESGPALEGEEVERHPAYGQVGISRCQGQTKLFGSALDYHGSFIKLTVRRCERRHSLHRDWYFGRGEIVEVWMSHAQFAEMITTPNVGMGVPCTIRFHSTKPGPGEIPRIADEVRTEAEKVVEGFKEDQTRIVGTLHEKMAEAAVILDKKGGINKGDREAIRDLLEFVIREVELNRPFAVKSFQEAAEKVVTQSKAEVEALVGMTLRRLGLTKLSELHELAPRTRRVALPPRGDSDD